LRCHIGGRPNPPGDEEFVNTEGEDFLVTMLVVCADAMANLMGWLVGRLTDVHDDVVTFGE
jgi:hypothetical protein